ncbi:acetylornithine deacetylase [Paracoccus sp. MBLB3053]|uniref:Acetylornithine deacetylase n=1 Tax=Paracoccus aurantius TaxID=3073814 RepID=A0ABU2HUR7_9RHOB|nr:acetylornithine deacetylase [Paracoccus sp. MBLB3053]MDS9468794.1 acetylornithine deacetylase [Paracoccus sp. MBLB3053]
MNAPYPATLEILDRLVAFPTVSAESNLGLIGYAEDLLKTAGFQTYRLPASCGRKAGLLARRGGEGPGGVMLSAHSDVVPVAGQSWSRDPFALTQDGERLYGRGTTDMKGFLASMLSLAQRMGDQSLAAPLMLAISYDEEVGCRGIQEMLPGIEALGWQPELCIVGEPTGMRPAIGHKGKAAMVATCHGEAGHSAQAPQFVNALHLAADFICALRDIQSDYALSPVFDASYDIPYSTVHVGKMAGGQALNIVPEHARIDFELRHLPGDGIQAFLEAIRGKANQIVRALPQADTRASIEIDLTNAYPGLDIPANDPIVKRVAGLCGSDQVTKVGYGTEAGYFAQLGIPTVVCGPGDMAEQGHMPDEFLALSQLALCDQMMDRLARVQTA